MHDVAVVEIEKLLAFSLLVRVFRAPLLTDFGRRALVIEPGAILSIRMLVLCIVCIARNFQGVPGSITVAMRLAGARLG